MPRESPLCKYSRKLCHTGKLGLVLTWRYHTLISLTSCFRPYSEEVSRVTAASVPGAPSLLWGLIYSLSRQGRTILPRHQVSRSADPFRRKSALSCIIENYVFHCIRKHQKDLRVEMVNSLPCLFSFSRRSWEVTHMMASALEHHVYAAELNPNTASGPRKRVITRSNVIEGPKRKYSGGQQRGC